MRGRKPRPISQQISLGDPRRHGRHKLQAKLDSEPRAEHGLPPAPAHLPPLARECYESWREQLEVMQLDNKPDAAALEAAAMAYCRAVQAEEQVTREGITVREPILHQGVPIPNVVRLKRHPATTVSVANWLLVKSFVTEFGMTPAARTRLTVERKTTQADDVRALLEGPTLSAEERKKLM